MNVSSAWMRLDCARCGLATRKRNISSPPRRASTISIRCAWIPSRFRPAKRCACASIADTYSGGVRLSCHSAADAQPDPAPIWLAGNDQQAPRASTPSQPIAVLEVFEATSERATPARHSESVSTTACPLLAGDAKTASGFRNLRRTASIPSARLAMTVRWRRFPRNGKTFPIISRRRLRLSPTPPLTANVKWNISPRRP